MQTPTHIAKLLNKANENEVHWPNETFIPNCKYRSVEWFSKTYSKNRSSTLDIIHFNVRSLPKNEKNIEELLLNLTKKPDIIAITETKLNNNIAKTQLNDSDLINCNFLTKAGGVALHVSNSLIFSKIEELSTATTHYELLFIEIDVENKKQKNLVIGVFYRHPSSSVLEFQTQFVHTLNNLTQRKKEYVICGDFKVDILKKSSITNTYIDHAYAEGCFCLIDKPTRIIPHSATLLDHFYSNIIDKNLTLLCSCMKYLIIYLLHVLSI